MPVVAFMALAIPASADTILYFTGTCTDCNSGNPNNPATAILDLSDSGSTLSNSDFVSLTYTGTDLIPGFEITSSDPTLEVSGSIPGALPGPALVDIFTSDSYWFETQVDGSWDVVLTATLGDYGSVSTWSTTAASAPEPNTVALLGAALIGLAMFQRRMLKTSK
jgi:hypothetical protein